MNIIMRFFSVACAAVALCLLGGGIPASGSLPEANSPPTGQENIAGQGAGGFADALGDFSRKHRITFLCEGVPYRDALTEEERVKASVKITKETPIKDEIALIAGAYDYDCEWKTDNLCLLRKRFTNDDDIPDVSAGETIRSLENILALWRPFEPQYEDVEATKRLMSGLTPEWQARLANESVPVAELPESVRTSLRSLVWGRISDMPLMGTRYLLYRLSQCSKKKGVTFSKKDMFSLGAPIPVYSGKLYRYRGVQWDMDIPVSSSAYTQATSGSMIRGPFTGETKAEKDASAARALTEDPIIGYKIKTVPPPPWSTTLRDLTAGLADGPNPLDVECDPILADKRVSVFGKEFVGPAKLLESVSDLYGLRITNNKKSVLTIRGVRKQTDVTQVGVETLRLLPLSLQRYIWEDAYKTRSEAEQQERQARRSYMLYVAGMKRLRALADEAIKKSPDGKVPLEEMPEPTLDLIALTGLATYFEPQILDSIRRPIPPHLANFDSTSVRIKINSSQEPGSRPVSWYVLYEGKELGGAAYY